LDFGGQNIACAVSWSAVRSFCQAAGRNLAAFSKPAIHVSQRTSWCVVPLGDCEQRAIAVGSLDQCPCNIVVMLHHEAKHPVQMVEVIEGGFVSFLASRDDRQPFARFDLFGADKGARNEAIEFLQQHCIIAKSLSENIMRDCIVFAA
jgi:hypothetical protein